MKLFERILKIGSLCLLILIFTTCQKDEIVLNTDSESEFSQAGQLKSTGASPAYVEGLIQQINEYVTAGELEAGIARALISKLETVMKFLEKGNINVANSILNAVILQLENLIGNGVIDSEIGEEILSEAELIAGEEQTFIDPRDNREYRLILIGNQVWMAENLAYNNPTGCWVYDDNEANAEIFGRLYDWNTAKTVSPSGWRLPNNNDWMELLTFLEDNGFGYEGSGDDIAKSICASIYWEPAEELGAPGNDLLTNNSSGFSGLPSGQWSPYYGYTTNLGFTTCWWSANDQFGVYGWHLRLNYRNPGYHFGWTYTNVGHAVRCIRE